MYYALTIHEFGIIGKHEFSTLHWYAICYEYFVMECALHPNVGQSQKWNVAKCTDFVNRVPSLAWMGWGGHAFKPRFNLQTKGRHTVD